jgi:hypothetical protein
MRFNRLLWGGIAAIVLMPLLGLGALVVAAVMIAYRRSASDGLAPQPPKGSTGVAAPADPGDHVEEPVTRQRPSS